MAFLFVSPGNLFFPFAFYKYGGGALIEKRRTPRCILYLSRIEDVIYVLHCFEKKSREMPRRDFEKAKQRLKAVKARLAEEKKREKRS